MTRENHDHGHDRRHGLPTPEKPVALFGLTPHILGRGTPPPVPEAAAQKRLPHKGFRVDVNELFVIEDTHGHISPDEIEVRQITRSMLVDAIRRSISEKIDASTQRELEQIFQILIATRQRAASVILKDRTQLFELEIDIPLAETHNTTTGEKTTQARELVLKKTTRPGGKLRRRIGRAAETLLGIKPKTETLTLKESTCGIDTRGDKIGKFKKEKNNPEDTYEKNKKEIIAFIDTFRMLLQQVADQSA